MHVEPPNVYAAPPSHARRWSQVGLGTFVAVTLLLAWRITRGVGLSDEAYYAVYLHDWMVEGIAASPFRMLHQTSVLLVYPAALLYRFTVGSTTGLMLFLRALYLMCAIGTALATVRFLRLAGIGAARWLIGALVVAFVPYNLPAPSYNTMALQGLLVACTCFGSAMLAVTPRGAGLGLVASAVAWAIAVIAYPPLLAAMVGFVVLAAAVIRPRRERLLVYLALLAATQAVAWGLVLGLFGLARLRASLVFQETLSSTSALGETPARLLQHFATHPWFALALSTAVLVGILRGNPDGTARARVPPAIVAAVIALLVGAACLTPPALFSLAHDAVLLVAASGAALALAFRSDQPATKLLWLLFVTSVLATPLMGATSTIGLYKTPVALFPAALAALVWTGEQCRRRGGRAIAALPSIALLATLMVSLFQTYYGELAGVRPRNRVRIASGPFAGLAARAEDAIVLELAAAALGRHRRPDDTVAVTGRLPGLYLLTDAPPRALVPYAFTDFAQRRALEMSHAYYADPTNRPAMVLLYRDPYHPYVDPFTPDFALWYELRESVPTPLGKLEVYRRSDEDRP